MAQKAYEAYGKSSALPTPLHLPFPSGYVPPQVSNGTVGSRRGALTTWARPGEYCRMARKSLPQLRSIVIVLAPYLQLARLRQWGPEGRRCATENPRTTPPPPPAAPPPPHKTTAEGRVRTTPRGDRPVPREQGWGAQAAGNATQGEEAESQVEKKKTQHRALHAHCPKPRNATRTQLLRTVRASGRQCDRVERCQGKDEEAPPTACASQRAPIMLALCTPPEIGTKWSEEADSRRTPPPASPPPPPGPTAAGQKEQRHRGGTPEPRLQEWERKARRTHKAPCPARPRPKTRQRAPLPAATHRASP